MALYQISPYIMVYHIKIKVPLKTGRGCKHGLLSTISLMGVADLPPKPITPLFLNFLPNTVILIDFSCFAITLFLQKKDIAYYVPRINFGGSFLDEKSDF